MEKEKRIHLIKILNYSVTWTMPRQIEVNGDSVILMILELDSQVIVENIDMEEVIL